jgi:hypothetical protein
VIETVRVSELNNKFGADICTMMNEFRGREALFG